MAALENIFKIDTWLGRWFRIINKIPQISLISQSTTNLTILQVSNSSFHLYSGSIFTGRNCIKQEFDVLINHPVKNAMFCFHVFSFRCRQMVYF